MTEVLSWLSGPGFPDYCGAHGQEVNSSHEWRQRYLIDALEGRR